MAKRKCLWYFSFDMALIFWWSGSNVSLIQFLFQPRILSLTEEKDIYLGCLAMTKKPTCDNSTLEALMILFLPAHDHKLSLLISLLSYPRMAWYAGPSPLLVSKAWMPISGLFTESWFFWVLFLQTNKTVLIPMYLNDIESTFSFFLYMISCTVFFQAFKLSDFILIEILAIIPNRSSV